MGHIAERKDRAGYIARWVDPNGNERSKSFIRKVDAKNHLTIVGAAILQGDYADPRLGKMLFGSYAEDLVQSWTQLSLGTAANIRSRMNRHILPTFGRRTLGSIQPQDVRWWVGRLVGEGLASSTVKATYRNFAKVMATAEIDRIISRTPCIGIELPRETHHEEMLFLEPVEIARLAESIDARYSSLIFTAGYAGARFGELAALKVGRVDLDAARMRILESLADVNGHLYTKEPKNGQSRVLELPPFLVAKLREQMGVFPSSEGYVFSAREGGPLRHHNFYRRHFKPAVLKAGLSPRLRFHDLRHSCASILIARGANIKDVQEQLGHSSSRVTLDRYSHRFPGLTRRLQQDLQEVFERTGGGSQTDDGTETGRGSVKPWF